MALKSGSEEVSLSEATLTVPIWHWGGNYNRYKAAKANTNAQRLLLEDTEEKVQLQVSRRDSASTRRKNL